MKFRPEILLFVLAPALLIAAVCNTNSGTSGDCEFGGPYPKYPDFEKKIRGEKLDDFKLYNSLDLGYSSTTNLSLDLLKISVIANKANRPNAELQRYNYAITLDCQILVAELKRKLPESNGLVDRTAIGSGIACIGAGQAMSPPPLDRMIDFAAEDPYGSDKAAKTPAESACWLDVERKAGILDAISKHFMLAQGTTEGSIANYDPKNSTWGDTEVAYAGEILVDPQACTYIVTGGSGTYRPDNPLRKEINEFFARQLYPIAGIPTLPNSIPGC